MLKSEEILENPKLLDGLNDAEKANALMNLMRYYSHHKEMHPQVDTIVGEYYKKFPQLAAVSAKGPDGASVYPLWVSCQYDYLQVLHAIVESGKAMRDNDVYVAYIKNDSHPPRRRGLFYKISTDFNPKKQMELIHLLVPSLTENERKSLASWLLEDALSARKLTGLERLIKEKFDLMTPVDMGYFGQTSPFIVQYASKLIENNCFKPKSLFEEIARLENGEALVKILAVSLPIPQRPQNEQQTGTKHRTNHSNQPHAKKQNTNTQDLTQNKIYNGGRLDI